MGRKRKQEENTPRPRRVTLEQVDDVRWRLPRQGAMRVDGMVYADRKLVDALAGDACVQQLANVATLPGIVGQALAMPDIHAGYGFPIGGVAAFDADQGVVSPGGVGYDINCGVRLHALAMTRDEVAAAREPVAQALQEAIPAGVGVGVRDRRVSSLEEVLAHGVRVLVDLGLVPEGDLDAIEDRGAMPGADPGQVSPRARDRGGDQLGSLGSGNHFVEVDVVTEVYDKEIAAAWGLREGHAAVLIHTGSRGLGHQVCEEMLVLMVQAARRAGIALPDKQLACAPLNSPEAKRYLGAMAAAANFAFANRALLAGRALKAVARGLGRKERELGAQLVYDVAHNIAKMESHVVDGHARNLCVHRKGATRALGPGHPDLPERFRASGQPVIIPGDMGRCSYVLCGGTRSGAETFGSACHGAGRLMGRSQARALSTGKAVAKELASRGITLRAASLSDVPEEASYAYKDVGDVVGVVERAGLARRVARLQPMVVLKG
jgi:tRNA-splicing ligase RtcB